MLAQKRPRHREDLELFADGFTLGFGDVYQILVLLQNPPENQPENHLLKPINHM
jgi:hypothetical protein